MITSYLRLYHPVLGVSLSKRSKRNSINIKGCPLLTAFNMLLPQGFKFIYHLKSPLVHCGFRQCFSWYLFIAHSGIVNKSRNDSS